MLDDHDVAIAACVLHEDHHAMADGVDDMRANRKMVFEVVQ